MVSRPIAAATSLPILRIAGLAAATALLAALALAPSTLGLAAVGLALAVPVAVLVWRNPELTVVALAFLTAGFIPRDLAGIGLGGVRLSADDAVFLAIVGLVLFRASIGDRLVVRWWAVAGPLFAFVGVAGFSALYAVFWQQVQPNLVVGELRPALYCAAMAMAGALLVRRQQIANLLAGLFVVADLTALVVVAQQFLGRENRLLAAMSSGIWQLNSQMAATSFGALRVVPPAHVLLYLMSILAFALMLDGARPLGWRLLLVGQFLFLNVACLLTYTRAQWVASAIALGATALFIPWEQKLRLGRYVVAALPILAIVGALSYGAAGGAAAHLVDALADRAGSIFDAEETLDSASLEWRAFEIEAARDALVAHPLLGVGLGNDYRSLTMLQGEARGWLYDLSGEARLTRFMHNGYLYLAVKMGLPAAAVFAGFALSFLAAGVAAYRRVRGRWAGTLVLPVVAAFLGLLEWSIFEAHLMLAPGMAAVGLMVALAGAALDLDEEEVALEPTPEAERYLVVAGPAPLVP